MRSLLGRLADFLPRLLHRRLKARAGLFPAILAEWHRTLSHPLAGVLTRLRPASSLTLAIVLAMTRMFFGRRACALPRAFVLLVHPPAFAGVQPAANVRLVEPWSFILFLICRLRQCRGPRHYPAQCRHRQLRKIPPRRISVAHIHILSTHCPVVQLKAVKLSSTSRP